MKTFNLVTYAFCVSAAVLLASCGSQPPTGGPGAMPQSRAIVAHVARGASWMLREASAGDLIYATGGCSGACIISYPGGQLVGSASISGGVEGDCSDQNGTVFVTNDTKVLEYAHGGTSPIATLSLPGNQASGCSIDAVTGNLAVVLKGSGADIAVFPRASGTPSLYVSEIDSIYCGYDGSGNLFVSGYNGQQHAFSELPKGAADFLILSVTGKLGEPGQVQWDGKHITYESRTPGAIKVSRLAISGSTATVVGTSRFKDDLRNALQSWIYGDRTLIPYSTRGLHLNKIGVWAYPKGGKVVSKFQHLPGSQSWFLMGVTLSIAPSR